MTSVMVLSLFFIWTPNINSNGVVCMARWYVLFKHLWTSFTELNHRSQSWTNLANEEITMRWILSICPFPLGTPVVMWISSIPSVLQKSVKAFAVNAVSLSVTILRGFPKIDVITFTFVIVSAAVVDFTGNNQTNFVNESMMAKMWLYSMFVDGMGPRWSMCRVSSGTGSWKLDGGCPLSFPVFYQLGCTARNLKSRARFCYEDSV